jgi:hypothetical protein
MQQRLVSMQAELRKENAQREKDLKTAVTSHVFWCETRITEALARGESSCTFEIKAQLHDVFYYDPEAVVRVVIALIGSKEPYKATRIANTLSIEIAWEMDAETRMAARKMNEMMASAEAQKQALLALRVQKPEIYSPADTDFVVLVKAVDDAAKSQLNAKRAVIDLS